MISGNINVLVVFANPQGMEVLRLGEEERAMREAIRLSRYREKIDFEILHASTIHDVRRALLQKNFHFVHISGHGHDAGLILEDVQGDVHSIPQEALADLLGAYSPPLACALLNACYSISQGHLISSGVPYTIGMEGPVGDRASIEFTRGFYDAIGVGKSIDFAYEEGCRTVKLAAPGSQFISQLLKR
jgi:hypothetical protein